MSIENYIKKKKTQKIADMFDVKQFIITQSEEIVNSFLDVLKPQIIKETQDKLNETIDKLIKDVKKGDKGDKGDSIKGDKGDSIVGPKGDKGDPGKKGKDGVGIKGDKGDQGKDGSPDKPIQIADKLNTLEEKVEINVIKGLKNYLDTLKTNIREVKSGKSLGGGGMGLPVHKTFNVNSTTTSSTLPFKVAAGGNAIWAFYQGQFLVKGTHYNVSGETITWLETFEDGTFVDVTFIRR